MKTKLLHVLSLVLTMFVMSQLFCPLYAKENTFPINSVDDLNRIRSNLSGNYSLNCDLDFSDIPHFNPIGDQDHPFTGKFSGNGHVIRNLKINAYPVISRDGESRSFGLFARTNGARIEQLGIVNASYQVDGELDHVDGGFLNVGGFVGLAESTEFRECWFDGDLKITAGRGLYTRMGGIAAAGIASDFIACLAQGTQTTKAIDKNSMVGGICAWFDRGTIDQSVAWISTVSVETKVGYVYVGGIQASGAEDSEETPSLLRQSLVFKPELHIVTSGRGEPIVTDIGLTGRCENCKLISENEGWADVRIYSNEYLDQDVWSIDNQYVFLKCFEEGDFDRTVSMYRLYNPNSGEHFYTASEAEKEHLAIVGWHYEGIGWKAPIRSRVQVYRLYNPNAGDHHYTLNTKEKDKLVSLGRKYEGIGWYSDEFCFVPLYRQYNPNAKSGSHNYTVNKNEHNFLVSKGWKGEGIAWYGLETGNQ